MGAKDIQGMTEVKRPVKQEKCYLLQGLTDRGISIVLGVVLDPKGRCHKWHSSLIL
ncbi:MAG: hypothetical protein M3Y53_01110 [Thermoproteota archaeon]|nr:hypothetical protein [Thermoproteota archaeon]